MTSSLGTCAAGSGHWLTDPGGFIGQRESPDAPWLCARHRAPLFAPPAIGDRVRYIDGHQGEDYTIVAVDGDQVRYAVFGSDTSHVASRHVFYRSNPNVPYEAGPSCGPALPTRKSTKEN